MTKDEEMWGRWYNKEEEEAKIIEEIKLEVLENVLKGNVQSGLAKEVFDELVKIKSKEGEEKEFIQKMHQNGMSIQEIASMIEMNEQEVQKYI